MKRDPGRKSSKKSKRKTQRDNERAARFQERKRQEREAAVSEASKENLPSPSITSPPALSAASSPRVEFNFSKPAPADVSENSDSSKMTIDGNETLPLGEMKEASSSFSRMNVDGNVTSISVSDNLTLEDSAKATSEASKGPSEADHDKIMKALQELSRNIDKLNAALHRCIDRK